MDILLEFKCSVRGPSTFPPFSLHLGLFPGAHFTAVGAVTWRVVRIECGRMSVGCIIPSLTVAMLLSG